MTTARNSGAIDGAFAVTLFDDLHNEPGCQYGCVIVPPRDPTAVETGAGARLVAQLAVSNAAGGDAGALARFGVRTKGGNQAAQLAALAAGDQYGVGATMIRALDAGLAALLIRGFNPYDHLLRCDVLNAWLAWFVAGGTTSGGGLLRTINVTLPATMRVG